MNPFILPDADASASGAYLVAFSGGADSRLLLELTLRVLLERHGEAGRSLVIAAHLHHGIRGEEADRDAEFCRGVCAELGVELISGRVDVPALAAASGESPETAARRARYDFLERILAERGIPVLLTAHHADDNLETVLERLLRGSGTRGMGGIPPMRPLSGRTTAAGITPAIHRPLLDWTRRDILEACEALGLTYVTDSTNLETDCTRNHLRHAVIPVLEELAGENVPQRTATRLSKASREDEDCLRGLAEALVEHARSPEGDGLCAETLRDQHPAISKRAMAILYEVVADGSRLRDGTGTLSAAHLDALCELVAKGIPESSVTLPGGLQARLRGDWLYIRPATELALPLPPEETALLPEGVTAWGGVTVTVERLSAPTERPFDDTAFASVIFPADLPLPLLLRSRRAGDAILSHGMTKKLKKLLCDKNIPLHLRERIPLICLPDGEPLWYPGAAFRDGFPAPSEGPCVRITVRLIP